MNCYYRLPFNWKTPFGYPFALLFLAAAAYVFMIMIFCILGLIIGFCVFSVALAKDMKINLNLIKMQVGSNIGRKPVLSSETEIEIKKNLFDIIRIQSDAKQLSEMKSFKFFDESNYLFFLLQLKIDSTML